MKTEACAPGTASLLGSASPARLGVSSKSFRSFNRSDNARNGLPVLKNAAFCSPGAEAPCEERFIFPSGSLDFMIALMLCPTKKTVGGMKNAGYRYAVDGHKGDIPAANVAKGAERLKMGDFGVDDVAAGETFYVIVLQSC